MRKIMIGLVLVALIACIGAVSATRTGPLYWEAPQLHCTDIISNYAEYETGSSSGTFTNSDGFRVTVNVADSQNIGWSSNWPVVAVIAHDGGDYLNYYLYTPGQMSDTGLKTPFNHGGNPGAVSYLRFCYSEGTSAPEFPAVALPVGMIIGFLGLVLYIRGTKEN